jgi:hypothetical protein
LDGTPQFPQFVKAGCAMPDAFQFESARYRLIQSQLATARQLDHLIGANHTSDFWSIVRAKTPTMD